MLCLQFIEWGLWTLFFIFILLIRENNDKIMRTKSTLLKFKFQTSILCFELQDTQFKVNSKVSLQNKLLINPLEMNQVKTQENRI